MKRLGAWAIAGVLLVAAGAATAGEVTLKAVNAFVADTFFARRFEAFVQKVNEEGKGLVQIKVVGGPEAIPVFEIGNAVRAGVVDLANTSAVFHANLVPEALAMTFTDQPIQALRANGGHQLMDRLHQQKANMVWLARVSDGLDYHIYSNKKVDKPEDLKGLKLRSTPIYLAFFRALGASALQVAPGEVYTALERGVVDGYGWPSVGVMDLGWQEKTRYRIDPGFYNVEVSLFMNKRSWEGLSPEQRQFLDKMVQWVEADNARDPVLAAEEKQRLQQAGVQILQWAPEQAEALREAAYGAGWAAIKKVNPKDAPEIEKLFRTGKP
ncbi:ABC transporter substrate-binding protein [Allofranklinella schreckenbergeri]|uniref:ABC transporter substrate-binding protein n=1 Tax=Allofranklinella schreckenbergeri TaxID=1076744 RepID=A0A3M6Q9B7_9BURK|nr:TRAP transporter substrate-binding protein DctP [Allofranklinella schreckenbergeri]RMW99777.1 ABC transporter substrate-binding protein [Allofranklinella schreckenbergeri]